MLALTTAASVATGCSRCAVPITDTSATSLARIALEESVGALRAACSGRGGADGCVELRTLALGDIVHASLTQLQSGAHYRVVASTSAGDIAINLARHSFPVCALVVEGAVLASPLRAQDLVLLDEPLRLPAQGRLVDDSCRVRSPPPAPFVASPSPPPLAPPWPPPAPPSPPLPPAGVAIAAANLITPASEAGIAAVLLLLLVLSCLCARRVVLRRQHQDVLPLAKSQPNGQRAAGEKARPPAQGPLLESPMPQRLAHGENRGGPVAYVDSRRCPATHKLLNLCRCEVCEHMDGSSVVGSAEQQAAYAAERRRSREEELERLTSSARKGKGARQSGMPSASRAAGADASPPISPVPYRGGAEEEPGDSDQQLGAGSPAGGLCNRGIGSVCAFHTSSAVFVPSLALSVTPRSGPSEDDSVSLSDEGDGWGGASARESMRESYQRLQGAWHTGEACVSSLSFRNASTVFTSDKPASAASSERAAPVRIAVVLSPGGAARSEQRAAPQLLEQRNERPAAPASPPAAAATAAGGRGRAARARGPAAERGAGGTRSSLFSSLSFGRRKPPPPSMQ